MPPVNLALINDPGFRERQKERFFLSTLPPGFIKSIEQRNRILSYRYYSGWNAYTLDESTARWQSCETFIAESKVSGEFGFRSLAQYLRSNQNLIKENVAFVKKENNFLSAFSIDQIADEIKSMADCKNTDKNAHTSIHRIYSIFLENSSYFPFLENEHCEFHRCSLNDDFNFTFYLQGK